MLHRKPSGMKHYKTRGGLRSQSPPTLPASSGRANRAQRNTSSSDLSSLPGKMQPPLLVLLLAFFPLPLGEAGEIIGGHEARPHSRPYMAYLRIKNKKKYMCGGVLVQKNYVLTAAHCKGRSISVILGAHNIKEKEKTQQDILVKRAIPHPKFNKRKGTYDIMLLQLERNIEQTDAVKPLPPPRGKDLPRPGDNCTVAGWGEVTRRGPGSDTLQEVELTLQADLKCKRRFNRYNENIQLCVGNPRENKTSFQGDSGGPLLCRNGIQGIVSYGSDDGTPPQVFTKVASFLPWIKKTMESLQLQEPDHLLWS
ncbi:mast cell protease 1A-like isoform X1 [Myotis myotis]|uniref:mast cell protease 1A-like isoform X1 n=1 Tax=Myotis myotis TaxID=51298 RepID=UPI00174AFC8A|nr:mast cell protease 1A-like isoform X1 [Myotis myotis]